MHILVTGGAGFIGSHLVDALLEAGHDVTVFDNLSTGCRDQVPEQARFVQGDIRDEAALKVLFGEGHFDVVFHEAAQTQVSYSLAHPREDAELNVLGLINVLEQCRRQGVQKFIYSSSAAVYGDNPKVPLDESEPLAPASFYGLTKVTAEKYIQLYGDLFGLPYAILRYANVYGERQGNGGEGGVVGLFARALARGEDLTIFGDGEQSRDFVYVKDVARANVAAIDGEVPSGIYNISTQIETTINALKEILLYFSHAGVAVSYGEVRKGDIFRSSLANGKAREHLRWRPKMKLMPGLMATYQYFIEKEEQA
ncbi:MAG: NAD-dependent epimerase/dehydratase family protein [Megasphaera elsdenii]|nr:NAD-dependent epimerase/dehydratase family protein [Megasphaera elsdenii]